MTLTLEERETIIRRSMADREWDIFTDDHALQRKLARLGVPPTGEEGPYYRIPLSWLSVRPPRRLSEAQKAAAALGLAKARSRQPTPGTGGPGDMP